MQINLQCYGAFDTLREDFKLNVYRIIQELLKNITQHSFASNVLVQLLINKNIMTLTVEDDGNGFDTNEITKGIGLHNLRTRVSSLDGHFTLSSVPGEGTSVFIEFDIPFEPMDLPA